eukprot:TRINITY_DN137_c8_g1_i1.p1 TRINITY_DN137_c8_g1~~TRINITY_DN137_c8_g1_i1.p1  ORF type:complete len:1339 (+),score=389.76 TRINITY_DN137_c8_g1_i1:80-4096(+)
MAKAVQINAAAQSSHLAAMMQEESDSVDDVRKKHNRALFPKTRIVENSSANSIPKRKSIGSSVEEFVKQIAMGQSDSETVQRKRFMLLPDSPLLIYWNLVIILFIVLYIFVVPLRMAWSDDSDFISGEGIWLFLDFLADSVFLFDIAINFRTAIKKDGNYFFDMKTISREYLKKWFWLDLFASIPTSYLMLLGANSASTAFLSRSGKLGKLLRTLRVFKLFRMFRLSRVMDYIRTYTTVNPSLIRFFRIIGILIVMWHWIASGYWFIANTEGLCDWQPDNSWSVAEQAEYYEWGSSDAVPNGFVNCATDWAPWKLILEESFWTQYVHSFFWAIVVTTGVGRDIIPQTNLETTFSILVIVTGVIMYAIIIGSLTSILQHKDMTNEIRAKKMETITEFMRFNRVPHYLQSAIKDYYTYLFSRQRKLDEKVFHDLNPALQMRLKITLSWESFMKVNIFKGCSPEVALSLIRRFGSAISVPGEHIVSEGSTGDEMYIIQHGACTEMMSMGIKRPNTALSDDPLSDDWDTSSVLSNRSMKSATRPRSGRRVSVNRDTSWKDLLKQMKSRDKMKPIHELRDGAVFGENALLSQPHETTVIAKTYCDLLTLATEDVAELCAEHPELAVIIENHTRKQRGKMGKDATMWSVRRLSQQFSSSNHSITNLSNSNGESNSSSTADTATPPTDAELLNITQKQELPGTVGVLKDMHPSISVDQWSVSGSTPVGALGRIKHPRNKVVPINSSLDNNDSVIRESPILKAGVIPPPPNSPSKKRVQPPGGSNKSILTDNSKEHKPKSIMRAPSNRRHSGVTIITKQDSKKLSGHKGKKYEEHTPNSDSDMNNGSFNRRNENVSSPLGRSSYHAGRRSSTPHLRPSTPLAPLQNVGGRISHLSTKSRGINEDVLVEQFSAMARAFEEVIAQKHTLEREVLDLRRLQEAYEERSATPLGHSQSNVTINGIGIGVSSGDEQLHPRTLLPKQIQIENNQQQQQQPQQHQQQMSTDLLSSGKSSPFRQHHPMRSPSPTLAPLAPVVKKATHEPNDIGDNDMDPMLTHSVHNTSSTRGSFTKPHSNKNNSNNNNNNKEKIPTSSKRKFRKSAKISMETSQGNNNNNPTTPASVARRLSGPNNTNTNNNNITGTNNNTHKKKGIMKSKTPVTTPRANPTPRRKRRSSKAKLKKIAANNTTNNNEPHTIENNLNGEVSVNNTPDKPVIEETSISHSTAVVTMEGTSSNNNNFSPTNSNPIARMESENMVAKLKDGDNNDNSHGSDNKELLSNEDESIPLIETNEIATSSDNPNPQKLDDNDDEYTREHIISPPSLSEDDINKLRRAQSDAKPPSHPVEPHD